MNAARRQLSVSFTMVSRNCGLLQGFVGLVSELVRVVPGRRTSLGRTVDSLSDTVTSSDRQSSCHHHDHWQALSIEPSRCQ
eukprot:3915439-Rhodomonas_salina.7